MTEAKGPREEVSEAIPESRGVEVWNSRGNKGRELQGTAVGLRGLQVFIEEVSLYPLHRARGRI